MVAEWLKEYSTYDMVAKIWPTPAYYMAQTYPVNLLIGLQTVMSSQTIRYSLIE